MAYYVLLTNFTDQGIKSVKDTMKRADAFKEMAAKSGAKVHSLFWTQGQFDVIAIAEAGTHSGGSRGGSDDDIAVTALGLSIASLGNVRTQTLRAFDAADMAKIIAKMG